MRKTTVFTAYSPANLFISLLRAWKPGAILLGIMALAFSANAQRNLTLYNLSSLPQSYGLNPGRMPLSDVYISLPVVGNFNAAYSNSGFTFGDLGLNLGNTSGTGEGENPDDSDNFFDNNFQNILAGLDVDNRLLGEFQVNWIDVGFRIKKNYFNFQAGDFFQTQLDYPKSLFEILDDVSSELQRTKLYDLGMMNFNAMHYRSLGFGYTRLITPRLSAGARLKMLSGLANVWTENRGLAFVSSPENDEYSVAGSFSVHSSGVNTLVNNPESYFSGSGNRGFAFDLGVHYQPTDKVEAFASLVNLGGITWKNDLNLVSINGNDFQFPTDDIDRFEEEVGDFIDSLETNSGNLTLPSYKTKLPTHGYLGANYYFLPQTAVGFLVNPRFFQGNIDLAYAVSLQTRLKRFMQVGLNYSSYNKDAFNIGAGFGLDLGPMQFSFASDNILSMFAINNAKNAHANFGLSLNFSRMTREQQLMTRLGAVAEEEVIVEAETDGVEAAGGTNSRRQKVKAGQSGDVIAVDGTVVVVEETPAKGKWTKAKRSRSKPVAEEPVYAEREKAERPAKSKPAPKAKAAKSKPAASTAVAASAAAPLKMYLTMKATAYHADTRELLKSVSVDVYRKMPDGSRQLALTQGFFNGEINVPLDRKETYYIVTRKIDFNSQEIMLLPADMAGQNVIEREFTLVMAPPKIVAPPAPAPEAQEQPAPPAAEMQPDPVTETPAAPEPNPAPATAEPAPTPAPAPVKVLGKFQVLESTSLRKGASHETDVLLRLHFGDKVDVLEKTNSLWWKARWGGKTGYVKAALLEKAP